jgi:rhodanese-related sulfurtransferase
MEAEGDDRGVGFLDVRKRDEFLKLHVKGSAHIPDVAVADRLFELPPPQGGPDEPAVRLVLVHDLDEAQLADLTAFLVEKGYTVVESVRGSELVVGGRFQVATGKEFGCLWRPNPALARCWQRIKEIHPDPRAERLTCIDLAAGVV